MHRNKKLAQCSVFVAFTYLFLHLLLHELKVYILAKPADLFKEKAPRKQLVPEQRQDLLLARLNHCWCLFKLLLVLLHLGLCGCHGTGSGAKLSADVKLLNEFAG